MWWSSEAASQGSILTRRPRDEVPSLLEHLGLVHEDGLWADPGHTVGVARSTAGLFVGWIDVGWLTLDDPFSELRDILHLPDGPAVPHLEEDLRIALAETRRARADHLRDCHACGDRFLPGQMYEAACCHSCAMHAGDA